MPERSAVRRRAGCVGEHHWSHAILPSAWLDPPVGAHGFCDSATRACTSVSRPEWGLAGTTAHSDA